MAYAQPAQKTYVIPIKGEINDALVAYLDKAIKQAEGNDAKQIVFEIDTYGGVIDSALQMSKLMLDTSLPTVSFIEDNAISAGVIISISSDKVVANKVINIGSAETRPKEEKIISFWAGKLRTVAEQKGRDPEIIAAMADADIVIEGVKEKGKLLNLTASQALKYGVVDKIVDGRAGLYDYLGIEQSDVIELEYDLPTNIARFTNGIYVSTLLLALGIIGLIGEIFTAGFGLFGTVGIISFALYFVGRVIAGHAGWGVLILFAAGLILIAIEVAIPGFGIPGIAGIGCIVASILIGSANPLEAAGSFAIAVVLSIAVLFVVFKYAPRNKLFDHIILKGEQKNESGYIPHKAGKEALVGLEGEALTFLRPAGTVLIDDKRIDVVTEGDFIEKGSRIKVVAVEGNRVIVRKMV